MGMIFKISFHAIQYDQSQLHWFILLLCVAVMFLPLHRRQTCTLDFVLHSLQSQVK